MRREVLGVLEFSDTATGHVALDALVKAAPVDVVTTGTVNPGKLVVEIGGDVASVEAAVKSGIASAGDNLVDSLCLAYVHPLVQQALEGGGDAAGEGSVGLVESSSVASGIGAADVAAKVADVSTVDIRFDDAMGGRAALRFFGELHAVETAVASAGDYLRERGRLVRAAVIPNPHPDVLTVLGERGRTR